MSIYFEGNGESNPVSISQARDQFLLAIKNKRDEILNDPYIDSFEDTAQRDRVVADKIIGGVLTVLDGDTVDFPEMNLLPCVPDDDIAEARAAGADFFDSSAGTIGGGLAAYWELINS